MIESEYEIMFAVTGKYSGRVGFVHKETGKEVCWIGIKLQGNDVYVMSVKRPLHVWLSDPPEPLKTPLEDRAYAPLKFSLR